jgi:hypothetical protein
MWGGWSGITVRTLSDIGDTMTVTVSFSGTITGFPVHTSLTETITAADLNGDGSDELIISGNDSLLVVRGNGFIVGEVPASGHPAVFEANDTGQVFLAVPDRHELLMYTVQGGSLSGTPVVPSLSGGNGGSLVIDGNTVITQTATDTWILCAARTIVQDHTIKSALYAVNAHNPKSRLVMDLPDTTHIRFIAAAGESITLLGERGEKDYIYTGSLGSAFTARFEHDAETRPNSLLMADVDRDNTYETIFVPNKSLMIMKPDGTVTRSTLSDEPVGAPVAADIDGDGYPEILQNTTRHVYAFRNGGAPVDGFPLNLPPGDDVETITTQPVVADLDGDGHLEVNTSPVIFRRTALDSIAVAYITRDGSLMASDLMTAVGEEQYVWPMYGGGEALSLALINDRIPSNIRTTAPFECYCYPNPITGGIGTFRITPAMPTDCIISVYTPDGRKVFEHHLTEGELIPGVPNEVKMNAASLASGLYIARIKTRTNTVMYKLGVLK